jgi:tripartite-type tricarboxylate transporter receptor subunit TctC
MSNLHSTRKILIILLPLLAGAAHALDYPTKPGRLLVGFAAGGGVDVTARIVAAKLGELWGQPVIVDNRPAPAAQSRATVAAQSATGWIFTALCGIWSHGVAPSLYKKLPYDHYKDFTPVSMIGTTPNVSGRQSCGAGEISERFHSPTPRPTTARSSLRRPASAARRT